MPNQCKERGCEEKVPRLIEMWGMGVCKDYHKVELPISGEVKFEDWMNGLCVGCIEATKEFEGEMSETPYSDYMPADAVNREWDLSY